MGTAAQEETFSDIREGIRRLCARFPGAYWQELNLQALSQQSQFLSISA